MGSLHGLSAIERFWAKVDTTAGPCWIWTGAVQSRGYGVFNVVTRERHPFDPADVGCWLAHRYAFERIGGGELDPALTIDHLCENRLCVNPTHLEQVTREENSRRALVRSA